MYQDAGYGENWQPEGNTARRFDPYTRPCTVLASLFAIGFVLIIIVVLSLIPLYISHKSSTSSNNNIQTSEVFIINYTLRFDPPYDNFNSQTILSNTNNRQRLQAALTSMLQKDSITAGSVIEISASIIGSNRKRRQTSDSSYITFNLNITSDTLCSSVTCLNQFHSHAIALLCNPNETTSPVNYQESNSTEIYSLYFQLPQTILSTVSFVYVDPKIISSLLTTLMLIDTTQNQASIENVTSNLIG